MRQPRSFRPSVLLLALFFHGFAQAEDVSKADHANARLRSEKLRTEAAGLRDAAEARFLEEHIACYQRFLVNRCIDQARERRVLEIRKARALDLEASRIDLADKNVRFDERQAEEAEAAPRKAVERAELEARNRAETEERLRNLSEKDAQRIKNEQDAKSRALLDAEERNRHEAAEAQRRAAEAEAAAKRAEQARSDRQDYDERARKAAEKKASKEAGKDPVKPLP